MSWMYGLEGETRSLGIVEESSGVEISGSGLVGLGEGNGDIRSSEWKLLREFDS